ncbi:hypothetical protein [Neobacillus drentensis]|uniref:hypothetical protein n=1 Tax=Neobacillus drentensis TaxID=220684 RepID=UPI002FFE0D04
MPLLIISFTAKIAQNHLRLTYLPLPIANKIIVTEIFHNRTLIIYTAGAEEILQW